MLIAKESCEVDMLLLKRGIKGVLECLFREM